MEIGTVTIERRGVVELLNTEAPNGDVRFTPEKGRSQVVLRSGLTSRAYHCAACEVVVFAAAAR